MKDWYMVLISDLKAHLRSNSFLLLNLLALSFLALITTVFWPSGIIVQFERPLLGTAFTHALLAVTVAINLLALNEEGVFPTSARSAPGCTLVTSLSRRYWSVKYSPAHYKESSSWRPPYRSGSLSFSSVGFPDRGCSCFTSFALLATSAAGWLGIYLAESLPTASGESASVSFSFI